MASARGAVIVGGATPDATDRLAEVLRAGFPVHTAYDGDAVLASLRSRYPDGNLPDAVADAEYGTVTRRETSQFRP